jgi:hypothetical protein
VIQALWPLDRPNLKRATGRTLFVARLRPAPAWLSMFPLIALAVEQASKL